MEADHPLRRALPLLLGAGLCFSTTDATAKWLVQAHALFLVVWARYAGQMVMATPLAWHLAGPGFWRTKHLRMQLARSLCLVTATMCFFGALRFVPLAEGSAITFLAPLVAIVLAYPVLGERPTRARWVAAVIGFVGILLIVRPGSAVFHPAAGLLLVAAISNALYQLLTRRVPGDSAHTTLFYTGLVGTVVLSAGLPFLVELPPGISMVEVLMLFMVGVLAGVGHLLFIGAYLRAPASLIAPFTYIQMLWATFYGWAIFDQLPDGLSAVGMAVIVASGVGLVLRERSRRPR